MTQAQSQANNAQATNREPTMEEILSSIRRIIEDNNTQKPEDLEIAAPVQAAPVFQASAPVAPKPSSMASIAADVEKFSDEFAAADVFSKPVQEQIVVGQAASATPSLQSVALEMTERFDRSIAQAAPVIDVPAPLQELRPILSEAVSLQVAKSFESLSAALVEERNTSVAQMTEEMMRPMLQDWLDNNLPTLVERLVREEIERVSRGTR